MTFPEAHKIVEKLNISYRNDATFKAAVLIIYCIHNDTWDIRKIDKVSKNFRFGLKRICPIIQNFRKAGLLIDNKYFDHEFEYTNDIELSIELTLLAGIGSGIFARMVRAKTPFELMEEEKVLLPEFCESLIPVFITPIYKPYEFISRFRD